MRTIPLLVLSMQIACAAPLRAPAARRGDTSDVYHGIRVADPYRWMEDIDSPETRAWVDAQRALTARVVGNLPHREAIRRRLIELWSYERTAPPVRRGGRYFFQRRAPGQNQPVLLVVETLDGAPRALVDPNALAEDGTVAVAGYWPSPDGTRVAYALSDGDSDWNVVKVRDLASGRDAPDELRWVKFAEVAWTADGRGFFYPRFDEPGAGAEMKAPNQGQKVFFHRLGARQSDDERVYERPDEPSWLYVPTTSDDGRWLVIDIDAGAGATGIGVRDLSTPGAPVTLLCHPKDGDHRPVGVVGSTVFVKTDRAAPRARIVAIDLAAPERWRTIVPEQRDALEHASIVGGRIFARYLVDAKHAVRVLALDGRPRGEVTLPGIGTVDGFRGGVSDGETFFELTGFTMPGTVYRYDIAAGTTHVFREPELRFDPAAFETRQVFYASKDGTRVPMFLVHRKGLALDGRNPTLLYGYGGFEVAETPTFRASIIAWLERGGVFASANIRGGGEYGRAWHEAGTRLRKQNGFDGFIAAAEWLIAHRYTSPRRLAASGFSNGGLLVAAVANQRPDLFAVALPGVPVTDMLRLDKMNMNEGWLQGDYGRVANPAELRAMLAYSPYHNVKQGTCYPATLVTTGDHDDRVFPAHAYKYTAALQAAQACDRPVLLRVETRGGHGIGRPVSKAVEENSDRFAFVEWVLGM